MRILLYCIFGLWICASAERRLTDPELRQRIDTFVDRVRECSGVPGLTLAVVKDGKAFHTAGYGVANTETNTTVDNKTMFVIASNTKAFVGTLLAKLIDQNPSVTWETPIRNIIGDWFYFKDAYRSQHSNLEDAISHRIGFPEHNPLRAYGLTIRQFMEKIRFFEELTEFRTSYNYNNLMYGVAQYAAEVIGGKSWEELTNEHIFQPLKMTSSTFVHKSRDRWPEFATPYMSSGDTMRPVSLEAHTTFYSTIGSPGSISSNSADMSQWLMFHINDGRNEDGVQVVNHTALERTYKAMDLYTYSSGFDKPYFPAQHSYTRYGAGWSLGYFRGYKSMQHYGAALGFYSVSVFVKDQRMGVYMSTNTASDLLGFVPVYIMDVIQGVEPWLNETTFCSVTSEEDVSDYPSLQDNDDIYLDDITPRFGEARSSDGGSTVPAPRQTEFVGTYGHYGYGDISVYINQTTGNLMMSYGPIAKWILQETGVDGVFDGAGQEPLWYWTLSSVTFSRTTSTVYDIVDVPFDGSRPPIFTRDLKMDTAPAPPELCP